MAANAAHLTKSLNEKPSIFEVIAQESLQATLHPALKKIFEFLSLSYNQKKYNWLLKYYDEVYLSINLILQHKYIKNTASSFAENFYGLRRISYKSQVFTNGIQLSKEDEKWSLFFLTVFPYLRQKFDQFVNSKINNELIRNHEKNWKNILERIIINIYGVMHFLYEFSNLIQFLLYMSGKSKSQSLIFRVLSLSLVYTPNNLNSKDNSWVEFFNNLSKGNFGSSKITFEMFSMAILRGMELGAFFIQFIKWWEDKGPHININMLPIPNYPMNDVKSTQYVNICPICFQNWKIPTVLPVSGYIFCYKCLIRYLNDNQRCPVTNYYAHKDDMIRLYM